MKTKILSALVVAVGALFVWAAAPIGSITFFNGSILKTNTAMAGVTMMSTNTFTGYLGASGEINDITSVTESNFWTSTNKMSADYVTFVLGGYSTNYTNTLLVTGAGSNNMNGIYKYTSDPAYHGYTNAANANNSTITLLGTYWLMTNTAGQTNYRKLAAGGLAGSWILVLPGVAPLPTSSYYNESGSPLMLRIVGSEDKSNWVTAGYASATPGVSAGWFSGRSSLNLSTNNFSWFAVDAGTNYCTNTYITNAYLHGYYH